MRTLLLLAVLAAPGSAGVVVSLTFDDSTSDHVLARRLLEERGMRGTFYVNSTRLGESSARNMSLAEARAIAAAGHEIGGHTLDHPDLTALDAAEARRQICEDRERLRALGFNPASFAYPFGARNAAVESIARDCGYAHARGVGGGAERRPPPNRYGLRTPGSVRANMTLADVQAMVTEAGGDAWVPIVFHRICDNCTEFSITEPNLVAFLDWLAARVGDGAATVRTVSEALGAAAPPPPPPPPGPPAPSPDPQPGIAAGHEEVRAFPNPWRADRHLGTPVTVDGLTPESELRVFTVSGRQVRALDVVNGVGRWDLNDARGERVGSGLYLLLATGTGAAPRRVLVAVIR